MSARAYTRACAHTHLHGARDGVLVLGHVREEHAHREGAVVSERDAGRAAQVVRDALDVRLQLRERCGENRRFMSRLLLGEAMRKAANKAQL